MNRFQEIEQFLQQFGKVYSQNPDLEINKDTIYDALRNYGLSQQEQVNPHISHNFNKWIENFRHSKHLNVYHDPRQKKFLQFRNVKDKEDGKYVKLYLNFSKEDIYDAATRIFEYINKKNIQCVSKVADKIRSDAIVLRFGNVKEANDVINFVKNDHVLKKKNSRPTNPFLYRDGNFGVAYDDLLSYNTMISKIIEDYFIQCRALNRLDKVSYLDFTQFVNQKYKENFKSVDGIKKYSYDGNLELHKENNKGRKKEEVFLNHERIYKIFVMSLNQNTTTLSIMNEIEQFQNPKNDMEMMEYYGAVLKNYISSDSKQKQNQNEKKTNNLNVNKKTIVDLFIQYAIGKYGPILTRDYLMSYSAGNKAAITRDHDFRNLFDKYIDPSDITKIMYGDINGYVSTYAQASGFEPIDNNMKFDSGKAKFLVDEYIKFKLYSCEPSQIQNDLLIYITGNYDVIPQHMQKEFFYNAPPGIITNITGPNIENYIRMLIQDNVHDNNHVQNVR